MKFYLEIMIFLQLFNRQMSNKYLLLLFLLFHIASQQTLTPILLLPTQTTQNTVADYAFSFYTDTSIPNSASISITFPFQYDARLLNLYKGCSYAAGNNFLTASPCNLVNKTFTIVVGSMSIGNATVLITNIQNPKDIQMSSNFDVSTNFRDVVITQNMSFGKLPFTQPPLTSATPGQVFNNDNILVEQGSTWVFKFTLAGSYTSNSTIRFVFPSGFISNKVQCNITGVVASQIQTRVFPQLNIYDCLNIKAPLSGFQNIILSGIVNPRYQMQMTGLQVQIIQPNNLVVLEKISIAIQPLIQAKNMSVALTIPNKFRNNTLTYIFQININSNLGVGDYLQANFAGNWVFFTNESTINEGINSDYLNTAKFVTQYTATNSILSIKNFSSILSSSQATFFLSLRTPLVWGNYPLTVKAYRANGGIVEQYTQNLQINQTTGYIREMRLHPMLQPIKLPVSQTGPLQITLALRNNLPQTNVLTYGKVVIDITPHIPLPDINLNGIPKCYFYGNIAAMNCSYTVDTNVNPTVTHIIAFTPVDFNFQSSQIPFMVTTVGWVNPINEGLTIDTLVKRYQFHIQFYTNYSPDPIPTQVVFTDWSANPIPIGDFTCQQIAIQHNEWNHLKCSFTTPNQVLNSGHTHIFRIQFSDAGWPDYLGYNGQTIYPDFPCLIYGTNITGTPYPKCDLYTYTYGAYASQLSRSYINIYGMQMILPNSVVNIQIPKLLRYDRWNYATSLALSILEDTYGYATHYLKLYSQTISLGSSGGGVDNTYYYSSAVSANVQMTNSVVNKVGDIKLVNINLGVSGINYVIFEVDQTMFPDIGRAQQFTCGSYKCSKYNLPIQYFIVSSTGGFAQVQNFVFPSILNPSQAGTYTFYLRTYKNKYLQSKISFNVVVTPDTLTAPIFGFAFNESATQIYPNTVHYYSVNWTIKNSIPANTGYIQIYFDNYFTLTSQYCFLLTAVQAYDAREISCTISVGSNKVTIGNMVKVNVGNTFSLTVQLSTSMTTAILPTISIYTYATTSVLVDQKINSPFTAGSISNTNLKTLSSFTVMPYVYTSTIVQGYFGALIINYDPLAPTSVSLGYYLKIGFTSDFYPYSNIAGLPLSCIINGIRFQCSYTLPFTITIIGINNTISTGNNVINITTEYLQRNGIQFPINSGRYLVTSQVLNNVSAIIQSSEQFIDILPPTITYFKMDFAHRDVNIHNIFTAEFMNGGLTTIPAYNDATKASRIYIGFPSPQFASNLGYANGTVIPCYFDSGIGYIAAISGKNLECRLRVSPVSGTDILVEIINFAAIAPGTKVRVFLGKIMNPTTAYVDLTFDLIINYCDPTTKQQSPQFQNTFNMFIDMLASAITYRNQVNSSTDMFQAGATVGSTNQYINHQPYTGGVASFKTGDWFIIDMSTDFPFSGTINNCLNTFYTRCIVFQSVNWIAIQIGNGTIIPIYPYISQIPTSISRIDTTYKCYTFLSLRWAQTITYTITATSRWMELRGTINGFSFTVLGSQNKLNVGQKAVDVLVTFNVSHPVNTQGTIQIRFPNNPVTVPTVYPHCRSAVSMGSALMGYNAAKSVANVEGQVGCLVQNTYSWLITSYDTLAAGSQVKIKGKIDFPTGFTSTLGTGVIVTYSNNDATNVTTNGRIIDYLSTDFPLQVQNLTWDLNTQVSLTRAQPLRVNHIGGFQFKFQSPTAINRIYDTYPGYIDLSLWANTVLGNSGGFNGPTSNLVCIVSHMVTNQRYGCKVTAASWVSPYYLYTLKFYDGLAANTPYLISLTTQSGTNNEGIYFPSVVGKYKVQIQVTYTTFSVSWVSSALWVEVYGPNFNYLNLVSTVSIPNESNLLLFEICPSSTITNAIHRLVIQIPVMSNEGIDYFDIDLGMGYRNYDNLVFDLYDSSVTSMTCKFYIGDKINNQPAKIVCNQYNLGSILTTQSIKFGFWVKNPTTTIGLAVPIQVYFEQVTTSRIIMWQMLQAGIQVLPTTVSPISDFGNFQVPSPYYRQINNVNLLFTTRNTQPLVSGDLYILKFNFDLRNTGKMSSSFSYPATYANSGDSFFLRNSNTIVIAVGATSLTNAPSGSLITNCMLNSVFYNPATQLTTAQSVITAYTYYKVSQNCQKVVHKDGFPTLVPNQLSSPTFTMAAINGNLRKSQYQDYQFTFKMSTSTATDTALVKKISIQFPPFATYDYKFMAQSCIQVSSSDIQITSCYIDTSSYTIWVTPLIKNTYTNNNNLVIQTLGKAIMNPQTTTTVSLNQFVIRYYTWPDGATTPTLFANSQEYCFMKQGSNIGAGTLTYTSSAYTHHNYVSIPQEIYSHQFLPASTDIGTNRARTPLQFKMKANTIYAALTGTNYHSLKIKYNSYYSKNAYALVLNDLQSYIPLCELNGFRILKCTIDSIYITMQFQQPLASGQQFSAKFSIRDPRDKQSDGFRLSSTTTPTIYIPIYITPWGGATYYVEEQPFPCYYKVSGTYPSMGIVSATLAFGTQVAGKLNYLDFSLVFSRTDITGLVLQIPLIKSDGSSVYNNPTLLNLPSGSDYPCSVGHGLSVFCYYEQGHTTNYGAPTRIFITNFASQGSVLSFRMLFTNPDLVGVFPSFNFKAYGGTTVGLMGQQFMGEYLIMDAFKTFPSVGYWGSYSSSCTPYLNRHLNSEQTRVDFYVDNSVDAGSYIMMQWTLHNSLHGQISTYVVNNYTNDYDYFVINYASNNRKLFIVKKYNSYSWGGYGSNYFSFGYLRNLHFLTNDAMLYYLEPQAMSQYTCPVSASWQSTNRANSQYGATSIQYLDVNDRTISGVGYQFLSLDMGSTNPATMLLTPNTDPGTMIVVVAFVTNSPFSAFSGAVDQCTLQDGLTNTNVLRPISCTQDNSKKQVVFRNVNSFTGRYLKFYYYATTTTWSVYNTQVQIRVYANEDAYAASAWEMFYDTTPYFAMDLIYFASGSYSAKDASPNMAATASQYVFTSTSRYDTSGWTRIIALSSSQIRFQCYKGASYGFQNNVYQMTFYFYVERLNFASGCSVAYQAPINRNAASCSVSGNVITVVYSYFSTSNNHQWPTWGAGTSYYFTINVGSITGELYANALFATMEFTWQTATYYYANAGMCSYLTCSQHCSCDQGNNCPSGTQAGCWVYYGGCCNDWVCCPSYICYSYSCTYYYNYGGQVLSGKVTPYSPNISPIISYSGSILSRQVGVQTQLSIYFNRFNIAVGPSSKSYILMQFDNSPVFSNGFFSDALASENSSLIDCLCTISASPISITASMSYTTTNCTRYMPTNLGYSIGISVDVPIYNYMQCWFPGFRNPTSTSNGYLNIDMYIYPNNYHHVYFPSPYWALYSLSDQINIGLRGVVGRYGISVTDNAYGSATATSSSIGYQLNISTINTNYPILYISTYGPQPTFSYCSNSGIYQECRVYTSFLNHRYYIVARSVTTTTYMRLNGTVNFPLTVDSATSYMRTTMYWTDTGALDYYYADYSNAQTSSPNIPAYLNPLSPSININPSLTGSLLSGYRTSMTMNVYMAGFTLYSKFINYGQMQGSFIKVTLPGFSTLRGCSVMMNGRPRSMLAPFICEVYSTTQLRVYARQNILMTDYIAITFNTDALPSSCTYVVQLFDKYISGSDYSRQCRVTGTFIRTAPGNTIIDKSLVQWRRPVYRELQTTSGPVRFTINSNYEYLSDYVQGTNSPSTSTDAILVYMPSGFTAADTYFCWVKQYLIGYKSLYNSFQVPCYYSSLNSGNQVAIQAPPSYTLKSTYYYDFVIYRSLSGQSMYITLPVAYVNSMAIGTIASNNAYSLTYYDYFDQYKYNSIYPCVLNSIYTLTKEAGANNSLFIDFNLNVVGSAWGYFEFQFSNLGLSNFKIQNNQAIPCYLAGFTNIGVKTQSTRCFGYTNNIDSDSPLIIAVLGMAAWTSGSNFKIAFDNFNNPGMQTYFVVPIDVIFRYVDRTNNRKYTSHWLQLYLSDSINIGLSTPISGSLVQQNSYRGVSGLTQTMAISWPYTSSANISQKIVMKMGGGLTCCSPFSGMSLSNNITGFTLLWKNTNANVSVYQMPTHSSGLSVNLYINGLKNPFAYQRDTYQQLKQLQIYFYSAYQTAFTKLVDQLDFTAYTMNTEFNVLANPTTADSTRAMPFSPYYAMTYDFSLGTGLNSYPNRQLSYTIVTFTSGVSYIEWAHTRYQASPYYFNSYTQVIFGKNAANQYYLNISGMSDSTYSTSSAWYIRTRLYCTANTIYYTSTTYGLNGQVQFTNSQNYYIYNDNYRTSPIAPTFNLREQKYTKNYYQLQRIPIYAKAGSTASKLQFRFTTPYAISNTQTIDFILSPSADLQATNTPTSIYCIITKTLSTYIQTGISRWAPCKYIAGSSKYSVTIPYGNLNASTEYTVTILERNQTLTKFSYPTAPKRIQVSIIYNSNLNLYYGDVYQLDFVGRMTSFSVANSILVSGWDSFVRVTFVPGFTLPAASLITPVTQTIIQFEISGKYHDSCINAASVFATDGSYFASGSYFSHYSPLAFPVSTTRLKCGQYGIGYTPIKLTTTDYIQLTAGSSYNIRYPLIRNPTGLYVPLMYKFKLLQYQTGSHFPVIISSYEYEALQHTLYANTNVGATAQVDISSQQNQNPMTLTWNLPFNNIGVNVQTWIKLLNNKLQALTSIAALSSVTTSYYNYQFYPNLNVLVYIKNNGIDFRTMNMGIFPTNIDERKFTVSWATIVHSQIDRWTVGQLTYNVPYRSAWTSSSFAKISGLQSTQSQGIFQVTFASTALSFPQGSYMLITIINGPGLTIMDDYCKSMTNFYQGSNTNSNLVCKRYSATQIIIQGYALISVTTSLKFQIYLKAATNSFGTWYPQANILVYSQDDKLIISAVTDTMTYTISTYGATNLKLENAMRYNPMMGAARQIFLQFQLSTYTLTTSQYIQVDFGTWTLDPATSGSIIAKYQVNGNSYWIPSVLTWVSANKYNFGIYTNFTAYTMPVSNLITLRLDHVNPDSYNGLKIPNYQWNYFKITANNAANTVLQQQYASIWVEPYNHLSLTVTPALNYVNAVSMYQFTVSPNVTAAVGDYILMEFTTDDQLYSDLFPINMGKTIPAGNSLEISCRQSDPTNKLISSNNIKCQLFNGDIGPNPSIPATIRIRVQKVIAANSLLKFNILSLQNPVRSLYPIGVTFKLANTCIQSNDINRLCPYYKSIKYLTFQAAQAVPGVSSSYGSLTFSPNIISYVGSKHTVSAPISIVTGDIIKIIYYGAVTVAQTCTLQTANGVCYAYPLQNTIIIKALSSQGSYSFVLTNMVNLYQYTSDNLYTQVWKLSTGAISNRFYTSYTVGIIYNDPTTSNPLTMTFTPTLTTNYQLAYQFKNIALIEISYLMQNANIQQIYIQAASSITIQTTYCNATLTTNATFAKPYPYRFKCQVLSSSVVRLTKPTDFPAWETAFITRNIKLYLQYIIADGLAGTTTGYWYATAYTDPSSTASTYLVSQAKGRFYVINYMSPYIYVINFYTQSFSTRTCHTGEQCMFYGYLLPSTLSSNHLISYMDYTIPRQFQYSDLVSYNSCNMKQDNSITIPIVLCQATRNNSKVTIRMKPSSYNHNYKLVSINHGVVNKLFIAPTYPGNHYQMKVDLYTTANLLIQSQLINVTTVYGALLDYTQIAISIPMDASTKGIYSFSFKVGSTDIQPAYQSSASNTVTSTIQFTFSNAFPADLGTGLSAGNQVACLPIRGILLKTMGKLTCRIYPSVSTITYPTIIVTGYDRILASTIVQISIAGLQSLKIGVNDYIKIGVGLVYYDYGNTKGYLYQPTSKVVGPPTSVAVPKAITVTVSETSSNTVGQLVTYIFTCTLTNGHATIKTTDFIAVQFPVYGFQGRFNQNSKVKCSLATGQLCYSYGLSNIIYFQPSSAISSNSLSFTLTDVINTAFSFDYKPFSIKVFTVIDDKIQSSGSGSLVKLSKPSTNISGLITKSDSIYGGQSGINYYFDFKLGTYLPEYGKISIIFPSVYTSLFSLSSSCNFSASTIAVIGKTAFCTIVSDYQVIISANGALMDSSYTYQIILSNLTNPNLNITNQKFLIDSYYSTNIYQKQIISSNSFSPPEINVLTVKTCQLDLTVETTNQNYKSIYSMTLICPSLIKEASRLQVFLPWNLTSSVAKQVCSSSTNSLYSYDCSIKNEFINNTMKSFLQLYLREQVPQKYIQLSGQITNGIKGSYTLQSSISYKGFIYLSAVSNSFYIDQSSITALTQLQISVKNYPYNRDYVAVYTFKITNPKINATSLRIDIPSTILQSANGVQCRSQDSNNNKDYYSLLIKNNTGLLDCAMNGQSLIINGLLSIIKALKDDDFLFIDVFGLLNPDVSVFNQKFQFKFMSISDSTGSVLGNTSQLLSYKVSSSPLNLQIKSIVLDSYKLQVLSNYSINIATIANINITINANSTVGLKIQFPTEYTSSWSNIPQPTTVKLVLGGDSTYTSTSVSMFSGFLMARFMIPTQKNFNQSTIQFIFRNPSTSISCSGSGPIFTVSIFDFKQNSILAESIGNSNDCLNITDKLYYVKISGNSAISSGNYSVYTIELQKPASYLKITPTSSSSAISFEPAFILFSNFSSSIQQFKIISSPSFSGTYSITFVKQQLNASNLFYNDIQNQTVTIVTPTSPYMIDFEELNSKSIGAPIQTFVNIQVPSTISFALIYTNNCSSGYTISPANRIQILAGQKSVPFSIQYSGNVVPYMCTIKFTISSLTSINYALKTTILYVSGMLSIDLTSTLRPMRILLSKTPSSSQDVGKSILTSDSNSKLKPTVYALKLTTATANTIQMAITVSQPGFAYYSVMKIGTQQGTITQEMVYKQNISTGISYGNVRTQANTTGNVNIVAPFNISQLQSDTQYVIAAYLNSSIGISDLMFVTVATGKSSNGAGIKISFNSLQDENALFTALSTVFRIQQSRMSVLTVEQILANISTSHNNQVMNKRRYIYEIVLGPNIKDQSIKPIDIFKGFIASSTLQAKLLYLISDLDLTYTMNCYQIIMSKPKIRVNNIVVQQLTSSNVKIVLQFWEVAYVYGVIIPYEKNGTNLLSKQISQGINRQNQLLNVTYRVVTQTDSKGYVQLDFRLLDAQTDYQIFVTAQCVLPYTPRPALADNQVLHTKITTAINLNLVNSSENIINQLNKQKNNELAQAVKQHVLSVQQKKSLNTPVKKIRTKK